jgi:integrase
LNAAGFPPHKRHTFRPADCPARAPEVTLRFSEQFSLKNTQLAYPTPLAVQHLVEQRNASPLAATAFSGLKLVTGDVPNDKQILHMRDSAVVLYKRTESGVWQVRFKLWDRRWHRFTTKYKELVYAKRVAGEMYDRARFKEEMGLPLRTKRFAAVATLCSQQLEQEIQQGLRPMTNSDYQRVIRKYLVPFFGKYNLTSLDSRLVREFEIWRNQQIGHMPVASTLMTHSAAFNRVIATAVEQGWLNKNHNLPTLSRRGPKSKARPGFTSEEVERLLAFMPEWVEGGHRHTGRQMKLLLRDYVELLLTTGMRCGKESMNMLWQHIEWHTDKEQRYLRIWVSGKTGGRWLIAKHRATEALARLAGRQKAVGMSLETTIAAKLPKKVFAIDDGSQPYALAGTFMRLLAAAGLSKDMSTGQQRTLYSLRHTYATMELLAGTDIHTVARQMGTSVLMLERHYSKLTATLAAQQLA